MISSYDEFTQLKTVIIGRLENACTPSDEICYRIKSNGSSQIHGYSGPREPSQLIRAQKQLNNLVTILENEDIKVLRPEITDWKKNIKHPNFEIPWQNCSTCPRDVFNIFGTTILEAPMSWRSRSFEYLPYRKMFNEMFFADRNIKYISAPKPTYADAMYDYSYPVKHNSYERQDLIDKNIYPLTNSTEPLFEAADVYKCGKDLFYHEHYWSNPKGYEWLNRQFGEEYNIHKLTFTNNHIPTHVDAIINIPRPGVLIKNPHMEMNEECTKLFKENSWEIFDAPPPTTFMLPQHCTTTPWIHINMLSINEDTIIAEASEHELIKFLENEIGLNVIPINFRDFYSFGGALHCCSLDIHREGGHINYF
jgi:glycine amidinotransferase